MSDTKRPQPFDTSLGLYFEGVGMTRIVTAEWKLMVCYNLIPFRSEIDTFADGVKIFSELCETSPIIDPTLTIIRENEFSLKNRMSEIQADITTIHNQVVKDETELKIAHIVALLASELNLSATRLLQIESEIVDVLTNSHHSRSSPSLLSPDQLQRKINMINAHLPMSRVLLFHDSDLIQFYNIMRAKAAVTTDKVIFEIKLPLI